MPDRWRAALVALLLTPLSALAQERAELQYRVTLSAGRTATDAEIRVRQQSDVLRAISFRTGDQGISRAEGPGRLERSGEQLIWEPPADGGTLRFRVNLDHRRDNGAHDAWVARRYALFRGEDAFPIVSLRYRRDTKLDAVLRVQAPAGWSVVAPYRAGGDGSFPVLNPGGSSRPVGWIIAGDIGTRREFIDGLELTVSAPRGLRTERIGMLAVLRLALPQLLPHFPDHPPYVSIVSAGDPFWLGALSAPNSVFVHTDRPLISENGTSTIVHELTHVLLTPMRTPRDEDWIDEGLAEYLSLRALARSGLISDTRFRHALDWFANRGAGVRSMRTENSRGEVTARAVTVFHALDEELRAATGGQRDLMDVVAPLTTRGKTVGIRQLREAAGELLGRPSRALGRRNLPGLD